MKLTKEDLLKEAKKYKTFKEILTKNRKLYYKLHSNAIFKQGTSHMKRQNKVYTIKLIDIKKLMQTVLKYDTLKDLYTKEAGTYVMLRRNGVDVSELYDNISDREYLKGVVRQLMDVNEERVVE